jgi:hypothetical protein
MALARIFSRHPEHTSDLAQQLQQQGYTVEVLSPDQSPLSPADLEIQLEVCDPASVLRRAQELAARFHADIAVAPGALAAEPFSAAETSGISLSEGEPARAAALAVPSSCITPVVAAPDAEAIHIAPAMEGEAEAARASWSLTPAARAFGAALAACAAATGNLFASTRDQLRESWELARIRNAEAHALREQHLLELKRQRAEGQQRALELAAERKAIAAYLRQLQQEAPHAFPDVRHQWLSAEDTASDTEPSASAWQLKTRRIHSRKWEAVFAGLLSASALFVLGLAVAAFHSRPAQSANGGATVQTRGVTLQRGQLKPASATRSSSSLRKARPETAKSAPPIQPQLRTPRRVHELVAGDVIVRHFAAPATQAQNSQQTGVKHYSDMEN